MNDVMFAVHTEHLAQLRDEAAHERLVSSVKRANAKEKRSERKWWRAFGHAPRRTARAA